MAKVMNYFHFFMPSLSDKILVVIGGEGQRLELIEIIGGLLTYTF